jgi:hypothetical protein
MLKSGALAVRFTLMLMATATLLISQAHGGDCKFRFLEPAIRLFI